jgi:hypothetical protein
MEEVNIIVTEAVEEVNITATEVVEDVTIVVSEAIAGLDAYQVYVVNTTDVPPMTLEEWQASLIGEKGEKGDKGDDGYTPIKGIDYFDGDDGYTPIKGVDYFDGAKGDQGEKGNTGDKGDKGDTGAGLPIGGATGQIPAKIDETNFNIQWIDPPQGGGSGKQNKFDVLQTAHGLLVGNVVRSGGANSFVKAKADTASNAEVIGIVTEVDDEDNFTAVTGGIIDTGVPVADFGTVFFLDPDVAGGITTVDPMDTGVDGTVSKPLLTVLKSGEIALFQNMRGVVVGGGSGGAGGLTADELAGIQGANALSAANPAATMADVGGGGGLTEGVPLNAMAALVGWTIDNVPELNDTIVIGGVTYTWKASKVLDTDILRVVGDTAVCSQNLNDVIDATADYNSFGGFAIASNLKGISGNSITLSWTGTGISFYTYIGSVPLTSPTTLQEGVDGTIGTKGQQMWSSSNGRAYIYLCVADNTIYDANWFTFKNFQQGEY